jgi:dipeptidyl aminopeptidase/acylaminoacyl peptidase
LSTLSIEQMLDLQNPQETSVSPDGTTVAFVVAPLARRDEHPEASIWLVPADGSAQAHRFTTATANERQVRWSPDGTTLAFLSDRAERGTAQICLVAAHGGEAVPLTHWKGGIASFEWSPDGSRIAFLAADEPTEDAERRKRERDDAAAWGEDWKVQRVRLVNLSDGAVETLSLGEGHVRELAWSPDGAHLAGVVAANPELDTPASEGVEIRRAALSGGEPRCVARIACGAQNLTWSPDGECLAFLSWEAGCIPSSTALFTVAAAGGAPRCLSLGHSGCFLTLHRPARHDRLLAAVAEGLRTTVYAVDAANGVLERLYRPERGEILPAALSFSADGSMMASALSSGGEPWEVWAGPVRGPLRRLTCLHPELDGVVLGRQEEFHFTAPDGLPLDGVLILPPDAQPGQRLPAVLLVHGGPYGRSTDTTHVSPGPSGWAQLLATHGFAVCLPNPRGGSGRGHAFAATVAGEVGRADYQDVLAAADALVARGIADPERLGIGGWSQGGFMTAWAVSQSNRFKAGVMGAGVSDWGAMVSESDMPTFEAMLGGGAPWDGVGPHHFAAISPLSYASQVQTPVLILHGEQDARVPIGQARGFFRALRAHGVPVQFVTYPREPHGIAEYAHLRDILTRVLAWYTRWLSPEDSGPRAQDAVSRTRRPLPADAG